MIYRKLQPLSCHIGSVTGVFVFFVFINFVEKQSIDKLQKKITVIFIINKHYLNFLQNFLMRIWHTKKIWQVFASNFFILQDGVKSRIFHFKSVDY